MTLANSDFNILSLRLRSHLAEQKLDRFQANLVSDALRRAADDTKAAMAHRLSEPLTALLLHLNEIKQTMEHPGDTELFPASMRQMLDLAVRETERACDIMELIGQKVARPVDANGAVAGGREAVGSWTRDSRAGAGNRASSGSAAVNEQPLTPREHEVLAMVVGGASNKEGGHRLGISIRTFEVHRAHLMGKLGARNAADLVRISLEGVR